MKKNNNVAVIIPFYRDKLSELELISLRQCEKVLSGYPRIAIKPESLNLPCGSNEVNFSSTISFEDNYFDGIQGYNSLMLSAVFYKAVMDYDFILIYQLDAFVFKDDLANWCNRNYDYIGAPWIRERPYPDIFKALKSKAQYYLHTRYDIRKNGLPTFFQSENKVGNGGFSLRKVAVCYHICVQMQARISTYLNRNEHQYNEDMFWGIEVNRKKKNINIPSYTTGLKFAVETFPERALKLNNNQLPFGCHAWDKYADFWRPVFQRYGYEI